MKGIWYKALFFGLVMVFAAVNASAAENDQYEVYALLMNTSPITVIDKSNWFFHKYEGQPSGFNFYWWVLKGKNHNIAIDTGYAEKMAAQRGWAKDFPVTREEMLSRIGLKPSDIDIVLATHLHFDHFAAPEMYTKAHFYIQRKELEFFAGPAIAFPSFMGDAAGGLQLVDVENLVHFANTSGRVNFLSGDLEIVPGVKAMWAGGHSPGHQSVIVNTTHGQVIIAGDDLDTYENFETRWPVGHLTSMTEWMDWFTKVERMVKNGAVIIPSHDPLVAKKYPEIAKNVYRLDSKPK